MVNSRTESMYCLLIQDLHKAEHVLDEIYLENNTSKKSEVSIEKLENRNLSCIARLVTRAAYTRKESRGTHMLHDYAVKDNENWLKHIEFEKNKVILVDHK